jgi:hypothetical protein
MDRAKVEKKRSEKFKGTNSAAQEEKRDNVIIPAMKRKIKLPNVVRVQKLLSSLIFLCNIKKGMPHKIQVALIIIICKNCCSRRRNILS